MGRVTANRDCPVCSRCAIHSKDAQEETETGAVEAPVAVSEVAGGKNIGG